MARRKEKVQFTIEKELLEQLDEYCDSHYLNRSVCISQAIVKVLNEQKIIDTMYNVSLAVKKAVDSNKLDEESIALLQDFEALSKIMMSTK